MKINWDAYKEWYLANTSGAWMLKEDKPVEKVDEPDKEKMGYIHIRQGKRLAYIPEQFVQENDNG